MFAQHLGEIRIAVHVDAGTLFAQRAQAQYRYESDRPVGKASVLHMDMRNLPRCGHISDKSIRCVITSPPYFDVTNYAEDQWLRLWFLGGPPNVGVGSRGTDDRHSSLDTYWSLLADMWRSLGLVLGKNSNVIIRVGATRVSPNRLISVSVRFQPPTGESP